MCERILGFLHIAHFANTRLNADVEQVTLTGTHRQVRSCVLILVKYRVQASIKGLFSLLGEFKLEWLLNIEEEDLFSQPL